MGLAIASNTGASLKDTAKLWETMTASLKETGATNSQILALTDTLQKIGRVGGSSSRRDGKCFEAIWSVYCFRYGEGGRV